MDSVSANSSLANGVPQLNFQVLDFVNGIRFLHGIKSEEYSRYRKYCSRRLHTLRRQLKPLVRVNKYVPDEIPDVLTSTKPLAILAIRCERSWSYGMDLKAKVETSASTSRKARSFYRRRFGRAYRLALRLEAACRQWGDESTAGNAKIYRNLIQGQLLLELGDFQTASTLLTTYQTVIDQKTRSSLDPVSLEGYKSQLAQLNALVKFCKFHLRVVRRNLEADSNSTGHKFGLGREHANVSLNLPTTQLTSLPTNADNLPTNVGNLPTNAGNMQANAGNMQANADNLTGEITGNMQANADNLAGQKSDKLPTKTDRLGNADRLERADRLENADNLPDGAEFISFSESGGSLRVFCRGVHMPVKSEILVEKLFEMVNYGRLLGDEVIAGLWRAEDVLGEISGRVVGVVGVEEVLGGCDEVIAGLVEATGEIHQEGIKCTNDQESLLRLEETVNVLKALLEMEKHLFLAILFVHSVALSDTPLPTCREGLRHASILKQQIAGLLQENRFGLSFSFELEVLKSLNALFLAIHSFRGGKLQDGMALIRWAHERTQEQRRFCRELEGQARLLVRIKRLFGVLNSACEAVCQRVYKRLLALYIRGESKEAEEPAESDYLENVFDLRKQLVGCKPILFDLAFTHHEPPDLRDSRGLVSGFKSIISSFWR